MSRPCVHDAPPLLVFVFVCSRTFHSRFFFFLVLLSLFLYFCRSVELYPRHGHTPREFVANPGFSVLTSLNDFTSSPISFTHLMSFHFVRLEYPVRHTHFLLPLIHPPQPSKQEKGHLSCSSRVTRTMRVGNFVVRLL